MYLIIDWDNKYYGGYISIVGLVYKPSYADQVFQEQDRKQIGHVSGKLWPFNETQNFDQSNLRAKKVHGRSSQFKKK